MNTWSQAAKDKKLFAMQKTTHAGSMPERSVIYKIVSFSWLKKKLMVELIAHFFIILFLYTGISKLMEFDIFQEQLDDSPVLGPIAPLITFGLPAVEFIVSFLLFMPRYRLKGLYASLILMSAFTIYVVALLSFSTHLPCSCGGIMEELSWKGHLIFNCTSILLALIGIRMQRKLNRN